MELINLGDFKEINEEYIKENKAIIQELCSIIAKAKQESNNQDQDEIDSLCEIEKEIDSLM